jgi:C1A family cysteine protease
MYVVSRIPLLRSGDNSIEEITNMRDFAKRLSALLIAFLFVLCLIPSSLADESRTEALNAEQAYAQHGTGRLPERRRGTTQPSDGTPGHGGLRTADLPSSYDSRDYGYITPVKDQGNYNTCWTFGTAASCEAYMIKHGIHVGEDGPVADLSLNLSEYHLAYYTYTDAYDAEGMLTGDKTYFLSSHANGSFLDAGGTGELVSYPLMRWTGLADESDVALMYSSASSAGLGSEHAYQNNVAHVTSVRHFFGSNVDEVKRHIMEYGAGSMGVRVSNTAGTGYHGGVNTSAGTICWIQSAVAYQDAGFYYADHDVTVVGWDDSFSKENFNQGYRPNNDGAWLVKNSWGTNIGDDGYFYVSYEDSATCASYISFFSVEDVDNYDHNYQYDGSGNYYNSEEMVTGDSVAQVFVANGNETLEAVALALYGDNTDYTVRVYTGCETDDPSSGTLAATKTGNFDYWGYQTIKLDDPVVLTAGQRFAIVITFSGDDINVAYDTTIQEDQYYHMGLLHMTHPNTSYFKGVNDSGWTNKSGDGNYRIKAFTRDVPEDPVPMDLSCVALGAVYQTISGTAGDKVQLPSAAPDADGWSFLGWVTAPTPETSTKPAFYQPGANFKLTVSVPAVYALYMRAEPIDAPVTYELVTAMPDTWVGKYVLVAVPQTGTTEYALTGLSAGTEGVNIENSSTGASTKFTDTGITRDGTTLSNVPDSYVFEVASMSYGLSLRSVSEGSYYGSKKTGSGSAAYALYAYPEFQESNTTWTFEIDGDEMYLKNNSAGSIPYVAVSGAWGFSLTRYGSVFKFYKQNPTENFYYATEIAGASVVEPTFVSQSLILDGMIGVNFNMNLPDISGVDYSTSYMTFSVPHGTCTERVNYSASKARSSIKKGFVCYVTAVMMAEPITATFHYTQNGTEKTVEKTYSVKDYFTAYDDIKDQFDATTQALIESVADYGHYVQAFLAAQKGWTFGTDYIEMDKFYTESYNIGDIASAVENKGITCTPTGTPDFSNLSFALMCDSATEIRVLFTVSKSYAGTFTATVDNDPVDVTMLGQRKAVQITNVPAHELSKTYTIVVTTENGSAEITASALSYVKILLAAYAGNSMAENAAAALYSYSAAADAYKAGH